MPYQPLPPWRIVVTDDDPQLMTFLVTTLRSAGHCVFAAYDGNSACELALLIPDLDLLITNTRWGFVFQSRPYQVGPQQETGVANPAYR